MKHRHHKSSEEWGRFMQKNKSFLIGVVSVLIVAGFVSTVLLLGKTGQLSSYSSSFAAVDLSNNRPPAGGIDGPVDTDRGPAIQGWAQDPDTPNVNIKVHVYVDKEFSNADASGFKAEIVANMPNHFFRYLIPQEYKNDGKSHTYYFYPIDTTLNGGYPIGNGKARTLGSWTYKYTDTSGQWKLTVNAVCPNLVYNDTPIQGKVTVQWKVGNGSYKSVSANQYGLTNLTIPNSGGTSWSLNVSYLTPAVGGKLPVETSLGNLGDIPQGIQYVPGNPNEYKWATTLASGNYSLRLRLPPIACQAPPQSQPPVVSCVNKDIMMVMDTSGGMNNGGKIQAANAAAKALVSKIPSNAGARVGLVGFGNQAKLYSGLTDTMSSILSKINLTASGGTYMSAGIQKADSQFGTSKTNIIVLLTDGRANLPRPAGSGPNDPEAYEAGKKAASEAVIDAVNKHKTVFYTVGLGKRADIDTAWLDAVAKATGGKNYYTASASSLDEIYKNMTTNLCKETPANPSQSLLNSLR